MDDTKKNQNDLELDDDDLLADDALDDLETLGDLALDEADIGDLDDESWDEFDTDLDDETTAGSAALAGSGKKSFFVAHFNTIVITIAVLGGGGFLFSQLTQPQQNPAPTSSSATINTKAPLSDVAATLKTPPMPQPLSTPAPEDSEASTQDAISIDDILMPDQLPADRAETGEPEKADSMPLDGLPDLDLADIDAGADTSSAQDGGLTPLPAPSGDLDLPALDVEPNLAEDSLPERPSEDVPGTDMQPDLPSDADMAAADEDAQDNTLLVVDFIGGEAMATDEDSSDDADDALMLSDAEPQIKPDMLEKNQLAILELESEKDVLETKLQSQNIEISDLKASVQRLEKKLAMAESKNSALETDLKKAKDTAKTAKKPAVDTKPAEPSIASTTASASAPKIPARKPAPQPVLQRDAPKTNLQQWVMRSAQPGRAVVSNKETYDLRSVAVGDSLPGLGQITAIELRDDRWIVQGTLGAISQ